MALARGDGRHERLLKSLARVELLILDDWGLAPMTAERRRDLLEIMEDRHARGSTIVTSQLPVEHWHDSIRRIGIAPTTVRTTLERFQAAGLSWPLPEELTDVALEAKLFAAAGTKEGHRRQFEPDYIQRELKRKHVTLSLLWERVH